MFWVQWIAVACWGHMTNIWSSDCRGWADTGEASPGAPRFLSCQSRHCFSPPGRAWCRTSRSPTCIHLWGRHRHAKVTYSDESHHHTVWSKQTHLKETGLIKQQDHSINIKKNSPNIQTSLADVNLLKLIDSGAIHLMGSLPLEAETQTQTQR